ncbi:hypothetical protein L3Q82_020904, partial [Scortum barcoo]
MCRTLKRINTRKAPGPDGIPGRALKPSAVLPVHTHDCVATHSSNTIVKFADDTTVIGLITGDDETAYREVRGQRPDILVPGQRQQNKGADRGLQEEAERGTRPPLHQAGLRWRESTAS